MVPRMAIGEFLRVLFAEYTCMSVILFWHQFLPRFFLFLFIGFDHKLLCHGAFLNDKALPDFISWCPFRE